ncbi:MAG: hypothetical protein KAS73_08935 [Candidatus Sabulitectum sp.]|nr:hypothetical protein [Candidatus Sabulitectum sp.]
MTVIFWKAGRDFLNLQLKNASPQGTQAVNILSSAGLHRGKLEGRIFTVF